MARPTIHHPIVQLALPFVVGVLFFRAGQVVLLRVDELPVQFIKMQSKQPPLGKLSLPTIYIAGKRGRETEETSGALDGLFDGSTANEPAPVAEGKVPKLVSVEEMTLADYLAGFSVDGVTSNGVFINTVFYRFGDKLDIEVPIKGKHAVHPVVIGIFNQKVRVQAGQQSVDMDVKQ